jgi:hypothetical protein
MTGGKAKLSQSKKGIALPLIIILWLLTAWLLYPLIILDSINMENAKPFLYRSAFGITIMLIFFGKTLIDLLFPDVSSKKMPVLNTVFLSIYSFILAGGIIFMIVRIAILFMRSKKSGWLF